MKILISLILGTFAFSAMASGPSVTEVINRLEFEKNVKCEHISDSFSYCFGQAPYNACYFSSKYICEGGEKTLNVKLKVKTFFNTNTNQRESVVKKVTIK